MEITFSEAWKLCLSDNLSADAVLWGISIFWWERIGKVMQFLGATTIVADIIGPEKIRKFGTSLQRTNSPKTPDPVSQALFCLVHRNLSSNNYERLHERFYQQRIKI